MMSPSSRAADLPSISLEAQIQDLWQQATNALPQRQPDPEQVRSLVTMLRQCAARSQEIGFTSGERELLRMARFLEGRISSGAFTRYDQEGTIQPSSFGRAA